MRTRIGGSGGIAFVTFVDESGYYARDPGGTVTWKFWARPRGGYVYRIAGSRDQQVCDGLYEMGDTLRWDPRSGPLVKLIRREWRKRVAQEKRDDYAGRGARR